MSKPSKEKLAELEKKYLDDNQIEPWEDGSLGRSEAYAQPSKRSLRTSIRLDEEMIRALQELAKQEGLESYQTYLKMVLRRHIEEKKKVS